MWGKGQPAGKNPSINPGQPAGKGRRKKNPGINLGQSAGKGWGKKQNPGINPGQPTGKGREKKKKKPAPVPPQKTLRGMSHQTDARTDKWINTID